MVGAILGLMGSVAGSIINNRMAANQTANDRAANYGYNEAAAQMADQRQRALYHDFYSPEALLKQYKAAGLSPSLMFGGTPGQGGTTGAQGNGSAGMQTPYMPMSILEAAQAEALMAQAEKTKAETQTINGENPRGQLELGNLLADVGLKEAQTNYNNAETAWTKVKTYIDDQSKDFQVGKWQAECDLMYENYRKMALEVIQTQQAVEFFEETKETQIDILKQSLQKAKAETAELWSRSHLNEAGVKRINAEIDKWTVELEQGWADLAIKMKNANTEAQRVEYMKDFWDGQLENLGKHLQLDTDMFNFEKEKFGKENKRHWWEFGLDVLKWKSGAQQAFLGNIMKAVSAFILKR